MRLVKALVVATFALTLTWLATPAAEAGGVRLDLDSLNRPNHSAPPPARTPSVLRGGDPGIDRFDGRRPGHGRPDHHHFHRPAVIFVSPSRCWQPGYWTYQWVPQAYTYTTWVAGQWSPDGRWIDGHYAPSQYTSGYYQPFWIEGYWAGC
jgi:hypothetical protein